MMRIRSRFRSERGIVMPATLALMVVVGMVGTVAVKDGIVSTHETGRDANTKRAVAAATAGIKAAIYATNMVQPAADRCVVKNGQGKLDPNGSMQTPSNTWCQTAFSETLDDGASYTTWVSSSTNVTVGTDQRAQRTYVSIGTVNGVSRRVKTVATSATGSPTISSDAAIRSDQSLDISNNAVVTGNIASNANINLSGYVQICGNSTAGPGRNTSFANSAALCTHTPPWSSAPATATVPLHSFDQGNSRTVNDNGTIGTVGSANWTNPGSSTWDPATKRLVLKNNATLTLTGHLYNFCRLQLEGYARLIIAPQTPGAAVTIYMDSPENCGSGTGSIDLSNNSAIVNSNTLATTLQIRVTGSPNINTQVNFNNSFDPQVPLILWAPNSSVNLRNNTRIVGAIEARAVNLQNYASVTWASEAGSGSSGSVYRVYRRQDWIDCSPTQPTSPPRDSGC